MTATFHLVRHAVHSSLGHLLAGRMSGIHLSEEGRAQAARVAKHLDGEKISGVISSPQPRAVETAEPIARQHGVTLKQSAALDEVDFGAWQGRSFEELEPDAAWKRWNARRGSEQPPGGEMIAQVQARMVAEISALAVAAPDESFVLVSHAEPIRSLLLHILGAPADHWMRLDIAPASISTILFDGGETRIAAINVRPSTERRAA